MEELNTIRNGIKVSRTSDKTIKSHFSTAQMLPDACCMGGACLATLFITSQIPCDSGMFYTDLDGRHVMKVKGPIIFQTCDRRSPRAKPD